MNKKDFKEYEQQVTNLIDNPIQHDYRKHAFEELEEMEKNLPFQPYADEYQGIKDYRENKKMFLFSDMQKTFAVLVFLMFFGALIDSVIPVIVRSFI